MVDIDETPVVIEPAGAAEAAVIWLHGLGADGHDFVPVVDELGLPDSLGVRFVFPHAPLRPVTLNAGHVMRAWYDIVGLDAQAPQDVAGLQEAAARVEALIAAQVRDGIAPRRIVLAGFSQGGAAALYSGLRHGQRLAGIVALSAYLPQAQTLAELRGGANTDVPIFMGHGSDDPVVVLRFGRAAAQRLTDAGWPVAFHTYPMGHSVCAQEVRDIGRWLNRMLATP